jgi:hypothetical protein
MLGAGRWQRREDILRWEAQIGLEAFLRREQFSFLVSVQASGIVGYPARGEGPYPGP